METDRIKSRIAKLLALAADDGAAQGEIDNAMRMAQELMDRHHLEPDDVESSPDPMAQHVSYGGAGKLAAWEGQLAVLITKIVGSVGVYRGGPAVQRSAGTGFRLADAPIRATVCFYGLESEVRLADELWGETRLVVATLAVGKWGGVYRGQGRSYCEGFVSAMLSANRRAMNAQAAKVGAIVLSKKRAAETWLRVSEGINLGRSSSGRGGNHYDGAYQSGRTDGASYTVTRRRQRQLTG